MTHYHHLTPATKDKSDSYLTAILTDLYGPGVILIRSRESVLWGLWLIDRIVVER